MTPDSFSDGDEYSSLDAALERARRLAGEGAAIIDVGGESTRPGAAAVDAEVEISRVVPVIAGIAAAMDIAISIDTAKPEVMAAAVAAGACIVNDIYALRAAGAREFAASSGVGVCLMHMQGEPRTMQLAPHYDDVVAEVVLFLKQERERCLAAGIGAESIALDPGIGFGKGVEHNLALLRQLKRIAAIGAPVLVGVSRKSFIGKILGKGVDERLYGGLGLACLAAAQGARIVRTHDVGATVEALTMVSAVLEGSSIE